MAKRLVNPAVKHASRAFSRGKYIGLTDINQRSWVKASSAMGLNLGVFWFSADHMSKNGRKTVAPRIFAHHAAIHVCFIFTLQLMQ